MSDKVLRVDVIVSECEGGKLALVEMNVDPLGDVYNVVEMSCVLGIECV